MNYGYLLVILGIAIICISNYYFKQKAKIILYGIHLCMIVPGAYSIAKSFFDLKENFILLLITTLLIIFVSYGMILFLSKYRNANLWIKK